MKEKAILFGASQLGKIGIEFLSNFYDITLFCDNAKEKWGKDFCDKTIISPMELNKHNAKIIITSMYHKEIKKQLAELGIKNIQNFSYNFETNTAIYFDDKIKKYIDNLKNQVNETDDLYKLKEIKSELKKVLNLDSYRDSIKLMEVTIAIKENEFIKAEKILIDALKNDNNNFEFMYKLRHIYKVTSNDEKLNSLENRISKTMDTKRYLDPSIEINEFFNSINSERIKYVVLEWTQKLDDINKNARYELLIDDADIEKINKYCIPIKIDKAIELNIYSVSGNMGNDYECYPVFLQSISNSVLENRVISDSGYYIPKKEHLILTLSYHLIYHNHAVNFHDNYTSVFKGLGVDEITNLDSLKNLLKKNYCEKPKEYDYRRNFSVDKEVWIKNIQNFKKRCKVELIKYDGILSIKKTWNRDNLRFYKRELYAYKILSKKIRHIPTLLAYGENFIIIPYYEDHKHVTNEGMLIVKYASEIKKIIKLLYGEGYCHLDFHPGNLIFPKSGGIKLIDFEFLYKYDNRPEFIEESYDVKGIPENFQGDLPCLKIKKQNYAEYFNKMWINKTGFSLVELLKDDCEKLNDLLIKKSIYNINNLIKDENFQAYQELYVKSEYKTSITYYNSLRDCKNRWELVKKYFDNAETYMDVGSQNGYFVFRASENEIKSLGVEMNKISVNVSRELISLNENSDIVKFINLEIDDVNISKLPKVDIISCFSVFHWWVVQYGKERAFSMMKSLYDLCNNKLIFETGQYDEKATWSESLSFMGNDCKTWIYDFLMSLGFNKVECIGEEPIDYVKLSKGNKKRFVYVAYKN